MVYMVEGPSSRGNWRLQLAQECDRGETAVEKNIGKL